MQQGSRGLDFCGTQQVNLYIGKKTNLKVEMDLQVCRLHSRQSEAVLTSGPAMILTDTVCLPGSVSSISTLCFIFRSVVPDEGGQEWKGGIGGLS